MEAIDPVAWGVGGASLAFVLAAAFIAVGGTWLTWTADELAEITGLGEALFGAVLLGGSTSLSGIMTSVSAAAHGYGELAVSNAIGGIAAQTAFLAVADLTYRQANLEHASASVENLMNGALLAALLSVVMMSISAPAVAIQGIHPASLALVGGYLATLHLIRRTQEAGMWKPKMTSSTQREEQEVATGRGEASRLWVRFGLLALVMALAGWVVARSGIAIVEEVGISETIVGVLLTALVTSLPELVTSLAAVHSGALALAVGGVLGGNAFDVLFIAFADVAFRQGSIYHVVSDQHVFIIALTLLMTSTLLLGLLRRERSGIFRIGFESALVLVLYLGALGLLVWGG